MSSFDKVFGEFYEAVRRSEEFRVKKSGSSESFGESFEAAADSSVMTLDGPQDEFIIQKQIRPIFGKEGLNRAKIGTHPDFFDLEEAGSETKTHYVCTLFVDIKGSTRLSLLYNLEEVYRFKDAVIKACIESVRSLDGYVHRIMGDAVMAFFGGRDIEKEDAIANALNCAVTLRALLDASIQPWMESHGFDSRDFGFRIGCDFGNDDEVLWGSFGYQSVGEVSATGLSVDMASKLQGLASKNQIMIGQGVIDFINWPEQFSSVKTKKKEGKEEPVPFVVPNITDGNGENLNYVMRQINYYDYLKFSALPRDFRKMLSGNIVDSSEINYRCYAVLDSVKVQYISGSRFLDKEVPLFFEVSASTRNRLKFPLKVNFTKTNYGPEVPLEERGVDCPVQTRSLKKEKVGGYGHTTAPFSSVGLDEKTLYRGLHTMKCEVRDSNGSLIFRDWIGVMIK